MSKKTVLIGLYVVFVGIVGVVRISPLMAAGDEVKVINRNGVLYLSNEIDPATQVADASTPSGTVATTSAETIDLAQEPIVAPRGFATDPGRLINSLLSVVLTISALLVFAYLIWGAFDWITSGGDRGKTDQARQKIIAAVVGIIIVAASFAIVNLVVRFLGFADLNDVIDNPRRIDSPANVIETRPLEASPTGSPTPLFSE
ncbi:MAG: hypothetical protein M3Q81_02165 [bacterium]|nr:hypothetical protein [bacterium]